MILYNRPYEIYFTLQPYDYVISSYIRLTSGLANGQVDEAGLGAGMCRMEQEERSIGGD